MNKRLKGSHLLSCLLTVAMIITCMSSMTFASTELTVSTADYIAAAKDDSVKDQTNKSFTGQALVGEYGYYAKVKVEIDADGMIASVNDNGTIPAADSQVFWNRIIENNLLSKYEGIPLSQVKSLENSIDSVTGATESSKAVFEAVCNAVYGESIDTDAFDVDDQGVLKEYTKDEEVVTIPEGVVEIDEYSFSAKEKLQKVIISSSVEYINTSAFLNCPNLSEFVINANNKSFYSRNGVIYRKDSDVFFLFPCGISGEFSIPDGVTEIGDGAFFSSALKTLKLSASVKTIGTGIIDFAENLDEIAVDEKNPCFSDYDGILFNKERSTLILVPTGISGEHIIPDTVKEIGEGAFYSCSKLTKISLPEGLKEIPVLAFAGCVSLNEVIMPDSLESIGDRAFAGCQSVRSFTVPENVSDFGSYVFVNSVNLTEILVEEGNQSFRSVNGVLFNADGKTLVQYPLGRSGEYRIPDGTQRLDVGSFFSANYIEKVTVPESVTIFGNGGDSPLDSIVFGYPGGYPANLIISANRGSAAEKYAEAMDIPFVSLESDEEIKDAHSFKDVDTGLWYFEGIDYAVSNGLMKGVSDDQFAPDETTTRAMIVTILYRLEGEPAAEASTFTDLKEGSWYEAAVNWAAARGIVNGYNEKTFGPADPITREQMAKILYEYAKYKGQDVSASADLSNFTDSSSVSDWSKEAMAWALGVELINGMTDTTLVPQGNATRAQAATLMMRLCKAMTDILFSGGSGTAEDPWQIATAKQLNRVRDDLTAHDCAISGSITGGRNSVGTIVGDPTCAISVDCKGGMIVTS